MKLRLVSHPFVQPSGIEPDSNAWKALMLTTTPWLLWNMTRVLVVSNLHIRVYILCITNRPVLLYLSMLDFSRTGKTILKSTTSKLCTEELFPYGIIANLVLCGTMESQVERLDCPTAYLLFAVVAW